MTRATVVREKLYPTPGRNYRVAWKWTYTVVIEGHDYPYVGSTLDWVRGLCRKFGATPTYTWEEEA